jgi:hypothetical protein
LQGEVRVEIQYSAPFNQALQGLYKVSESGRFGHCFLNRIIRRCIGRVIAGKQAKQGSGADQQQTY